MALDVVQQGRMLDELYERIVPAPHGIQRPEDA
jgi:hypothetical protein